MERTPKKSKALIIAFIIVIGLLIAGYFLLRNMNTSTKEGGTGTSNKIFSSLFGTSQKKAVSVIDKNEKETIPSQNTTQGGAVSPNQEGAGGFGSTGFGIGGDNLGSDRFGSGGSFAPEGKSLPVPSFNTPTNVTPTATIGTTPTITTPNIAFGAAAQSICPIDDPLVFTDSEKAELEDLLRQYYLIAPTLKTNDDLTLLSSEMGEYSSLIDQANNLTNQCTSQKSSPSYTGPQTIKDNPFYQSGSGDPSYLPGQISTWLQSHSSIPITDWGSFENTFNIW